MIFAGTSSIFKIFPKTNNNVPMIYGKTEKIFSKWPLSEDVSLLSDLLCGDEQLLSVEIVLSALKTTMY